ncbi:arginine--tRNA ligase [Alteribacter keqinensis]|uniref:Arginine--tRNA ligase n=1 Tax=Alteribacter keqinensis TaxID=2483800 RepID=A0A3M7TPU3_9BACI|nr:arginine--tRNA ligase [Alteribacter keqinensis]RNA66316.1 arginine--tRNA ligase [Alteribacter keqinensis]
MNMKDIFTKALEEPLKNELSEPQIASLIEHPKHEAHGDLAFPCFQLAKSMKKPPHMIAQELSEVVASQEIEKAVAAGPYVNVFFKRRKISAGILEEILRKGAEYGSNTTGEKGNTVFDFSSPNIAKPFSMGHLRSTIIGQALANIAEKNGFNCVRINHLGDWGTQFGKLMCAYTRWGAEDDVRKCPIPTLMKYYVDFHEKAENDPSLLEEGRAWFKKLELGDGEATKLWKWFRDESLKEFERVYDLLGIRFDHVQGESFYNDKMTPVVAELTEKGLLTKSEGAYVVETGPGKPPCLITKTDGTTLYATRDLAAAVYRKTTFDFAKSVYVVGAEQQLHFDQIKNVLRKMGREWEKDMVHVPFGLILKDGKKMSTRKGKIILLEDVLKDAISQAEENIALKNPALENKAATAREVGVGAVVFHDLKNERMNSVEFSLEQMLTFEGETGPYVQYTNVRARSILTKARAEGTPQEGLEDDASWAVVKELHEFPDVVRRAWQTYEPSVIARYLLSLASAFNKYYGKVKILENDDCLGDRLSVVASVSIVLQEGLRLLGIKAPRQM